MSTSNPRVAVIGAGHWGKNLVRNFERLGALAAICDTNPGNLESAAKIAPNATLFSRLEDVIDSGDVEAVAIATPPVTHGELAKAAISANKHTFVEKPLCLDLAMGEELRMAAQRHNLTLMVGHLLLYHPAFSALRDAVAAGRIGDLRYIYSNRLSLGRIRKEEDALWSFAPHDISMILSLVGEMPTRLNTNGGAYLSPDVADTTLTFMSFPKNIKAHIFVSWLHPYKDHRMVVVGSKAMIVFHDTLAGAEKLQVFPHDVSWDGEVSNIVRANPEPLSYLDEEPLFRECAHFIECIREGKQPLSDSAEGLRVLTVLDACQKALRSGEPVTLSGRSSK